MKVLQVLPGFTTGGPSYTVPMMCRAMMTAGADVELHFCGSASADLSGINYTNYPSITWKVIDPLAVSPSLKKGLKNACIDAQIIQTNSLWQYPNFITEYARRGTSCKSVIVPRGTLSKYALSISPLKKKIVLALGQSAALRNCDMFVATCEDEYKDIRELGYQAPVAIIPNGIDVPAFDRKPNKVKRVVFLSRIHKKKGVDILIKAWARLTKTYPDWVLSIAGPMNDYGNEMKNLAAQLNLKTVEFVGALYGNDKTNFLQDSELFVLPTHSENWGIAVPEALVCSTPAICTTGAPWEGLKTHKCGDWIELSEDNLYESMKKIMSLSSEERAIMGKNGYDWVTREFSWDAIGKKTIQAFKWLCGEIKEKPDFIRID